MGQQGGPPYLVTVVCEGDEMERRRAETAEERDRLVRDLERKYRNCLVNVASERTAHLAPEPARIAGAGGDDRQSAGATSERVASAGEPGAWSATNKGAGITQVLYTASATATGGRAGHVRSSMGTLDCALAWPKELGGAGGAGTNPEELFAAGYAACFAQALVRAARDRGVVLDGPPAVTAEVGVGRLESGRLSLAVELRASLPGVERPWAEALVAMAHAEICPYSRATRGNIAVRAAVE
jgi:lipoyl-dependent peroxiredoxin